MHTNISNNKRKKRKTLSKREYVLMHPQLHYTDDKDKIKDEDKCYISDWIKGQLGFGS
jgi:hypothetical protein